MSVIVNKNALWEVKCDGCGRLEGVAAHTVETARRRAWNDGWGISVTDDPDHKDECPTCHKASYRGSEVSA